MSELVKIYQSLCLMLGVIFASQQCAQASINIGASRIIFDSGKNSKSIDINNRSKKQPYLINVDISKDISGKDVDVPFIVTPALFRIEPELTNKVRIVKKVDNLPSDRESIFYFNALAIPTGKIGEINDASTVGGTLQVATGNTVKLFYRPDNLGMTQKESMGKLQFSRHNSDVKVTNPTPYYISLFNLTIDGNNIKLDVIKGSSMIAPFSSYTYPVPSQGRKVEWKAINDFGGKESFQGEIR